MRSIPVTVDNALRCDGNLLGIDLTEQIFDELEIVNDARVKAERANRWGWWDLEETFQLGSLDGDTVVMPRGYALQLKLLLRENGTKVIWVDRRKWQQGPAFTWRHELDPRFSHQERAVREMRKHQQGVYEAPTGSGKTMACIRFIEAVRPLNTIILVDKLDLMNQWIVNIDHWLGRTGTIGQIGNGKWVEERITVATLQTLWRRFTDGTLIDDFFKQWDALIIDECHHVSAETIQFLVDKFTARYRIGASATPDRVDGKFEITQAVLGEVIHKDDEEVLRKRGILVKPHVEVIRTDFRFVYWGDHEATYDEQKKRWRCKKPGCTIRNPHGHRNNYQDLKDKIVANEARNTLVWEAVNEQCATGQHHHLIVSDEVRHLEALYNIFQMQLDSSLPESFMMTGRISGKNRKEMIKRIKGAPSAIIFSTVAKEGLDIPAIDRIYLPFPVANPKKVQQWIGRGTRSHNGKGTTVVLDFLDVNVPVLKGQFRSRRYKCYDKLGIEVST